MMLHKTDGRTIRVADYLMTISTSNQKKEKEKNKCDYCSHIRGQIYYRIKYVNPP